MILVVKSGGAAAVAEWRAGFPSHFDVRWWDEPGLDPALVDYAVVWDPEPGRLAQYPRLKGIFGSGAGVDHIAADPLLPQGVPVVRCVPWEAAQRMGEYVCWAVLSLAKDARRMALQQSESRWADVDPPLAAAARSVGIMGMGAMGEHTARMLGGLGIPVRGWSRSHKSIAGVESFVGAGELDAFLAGTNVLVCLLPQTPQTERIIAAPLLAKLPRGAGLVQAGRGAQQVLPDILAALDSGQLSGAVLDVFKPEPLPAESPAWTHPGVIVTPHTASQPTRAERARYIAEVIAMLERGETPPHLYNPVAGY